MDKVLRCPITGEDVDRDINAARNLRDWPGCQSTPSQGVTPPVSSSRDGPGDRSSDGRHNRPPGSSPKTTRHTAAASDEGRNQSDAQPRRSGTPRGRLMITKDHSRRNGVAACAHGEPSTWARVVVDELIRGGVRDVVLCRAA